MKLSQETAIKYAQYGWSVFPVQAQAKMPACKHGLHDATSNEQDLKYLWQARLNLNIGIATGTPSGFWVLDIDSQEGEDFLKTKPALPKTLTSLTGKGRHLLFKTPDNVIIKNKTKIKENGVEHDIDVRGDGGYIVAPPSVHPNGSAYKWEDENAEIVEAPQWLIDLAVKEKRAVAAPIPFQPMPKDQDWSADDIQEMLNSISPDCSYQEWVDIGMALHSAGWPLTVWDNWSRGSAKYKSGEIARKWQSFTGHGITFGTMVHAAQSWGWKPKEKEYTPLDFSNVGGVDLSLFLKEEKPSTIMPAQIVSKQETKISGLVGDTLTWINSTSFKLQPELATMNILAALGAIFGRRYALQKLNTRTNIYMVGIAESGQGKDNSRKCVKRLMRSAGLENFIGADEVRSGAGLIMELKAKPSFVSNIDEIGMFMKALFDPKAPSYLREISSLFTKLYSSSDSEYIGGLVASKPDERTILTEPNLCIYGTTTIASYGDAMKKSAIASGELNRFIILKSNNMFPKPNFDADYSSPPEHLVTRWAKFTPDGLSANAPNGIVMPECTTVMLGDQDEVVNDLYRYQDKMVMENHSSGLGALWVRYRENILKVAMILAIARDSQKPALTANDIETGRNLVENSIRFMMKFASENMYDNEFQKICGEFLKVLEKGGEMTRSTMNRILRLKPKDLDAIESTLFEMGSIEIKRDGKMKKYLLRG